VSDEECERAGCESREKEGGRQSAIMRGETLEEFLDHRSVIMTRSFSFG
jgi:hypothetical protein